MKKSTQLLHAAAGRDKHTGALSIPIVHASTFHQSDIDHPQWEYGRSGNPTRQALEELLAVLEGATHGFAFSSGMAAIAAALTAVTRSGDHIVVARDIYGGTFRLVTQFLNKYDVSYDFVDATDPIAVAKAIRPNSKVLWLESPSNPLLKITDLVAMAELAQQHGLISIIDNTFMTPFLQRPLALGIDISVHSATKFLGGHSDLIAGAVMTRTEALGRAVQFVQNTLGAILSPNDSWLLLRGMKTLSARMEIQSRNASVLAEWLKDQPWVKTVFYPGLQNHPGRAILEKQADGFGAVVSVKLDSVTRTEAVMRRVKLWSVAVSLGGVESILSYPAKMSHAAIPRQEREALGITQELIRLSIGLEAVEDLIEDLRQAAAE